MLNVLLDNNLRTANRKTFSVMKRQGNFQAQGKMRLGNQAAITQFFNYTTSVQLTKAQKMVGSSPILNHTPRPFKKTMTLKDMPLSNSDP